MMAFLKNFFYILASIRLRLKYIISSIIIVVLSDHFGILIHLFEIDFSRFSYPLDIPMDDTLVAMKIGTEPPYKPINKYDYFYTIRNERKCLQGNTEEYEKVVILYVIKSALTHLDRRNVIRKTWGWEKRFSDVIIKRIFVVGVSNDDTIQRKINEEYFQNKDIVQAEFIDSYYNNTIKTLISFQWVIQNCPKSQFMVFSDDDMYISTKNMLKFIRNPFNKRVGFRKRREIVEVLQIKHNTDLYNSSNNTQMQNVRRLNYDPVFSAYDGRLFAGFVFFSSPMRHKSSKWYVTLNEYPFSKYPPYVTAGAYVLSYPALEDMYYTSLYTKQFKFDDVYLGIVAKKCNIHPLHNEHFHFWKEPYSKEGYANVIASHGYDDPEELKKIWEEQRSLGHA